ncbi:hypothetical protein J8273_8883 [Carpediemonas membranifera]|uniref:Uncharacterized protein n=1 Tax=Carpediemonas membranifera TaxID=201153 RepID=A0A8J6E6I3_9EUKA|nr:hypothetical protein J8273_8883 [Carpediemonas membranifera]|eukprot:KAG9389590.1 hypothetical protein J8273_8883 [Carpediemonas membranifera]
MNSRFRNDLFSGNRRDLIQKLRSEAEYAVKSSDKLHPGVPADIRNADRVLLMLSFATIHSQANIRWEICKLISTVLPHASEPYILHALGSQPNWSFPIPTDLVASAPPSPDFLSVLRLLPPGFSHPVATCDRRVSNQLSLPNSDQMLGDSYSGELCKDIDYFTVLHSLTRVDHAALARVASASVVHRLLQDHEVSVRVVACRTLIPALCTWIRLHPDADTAVVSLTLSRVASETEDPLPEVRLAAMKGLWHFPRALSMSAPAQRPDVADASMDGSIPLMLQMLARHATTAAEAALIQAFKVEYPDPAAIAHGTEVLGQILASITTQSLPMAISLALAIRVLDIRQCVDLGMLRSIFLRTGITGMAGRVLASHLWAEPDETLPVQFKADVVANTIMPNHKPWPYDTALAAVTAALEGTMPFIDSSAGFSIDPTSGMITATPYDMPAACGVVAWQGMYVTALARGLAKQVKGEGAVGEFEACRWIAEKAGLQGRLAHQLIGPEDGRTGPLELPTAEQLGSIKRLPSIFGYVLIESAPWSAPFIRVDGGAIHAVPVGSVVIAGATAGVLWVELAGSRVAF